MPFSSIYLELLPDTSVFVVLMEFAPLWHYNVTKLAQAAKMVVPCVDVVQSNDKFFVSPLPFFRLAELGG